MTFKVLVIFKTWKYLFRHFSHCAICMDLSLDTLTMCQLIHIFSDHYNLYFINVCTCAICFWWRSHFWWFFGLYDSIFSYKTLTFNFNSGIWTQKHQFKISLKQEQYCYLVMVFPFLVIFESLIGSKFPSRTNCLFTKSYL